MNVVPQNSVQKILLISLTNLGDVIMTLPVLTRLKHEYPNAFVSMIAGPKAEELLNGSRYVDELIIWDKQKLSLNDKWRIVRSLRKKKFDLVIDLRNTIIPYLIGPRLRPRITSNQSDVSMRARHLQKISFLRNLTQSVPFDFFSELEKKNAFLKLAQAGVISDRPYVALAAGAGSYLKAMRERHAVAAVRYLTARQFYVLLIGSTTEHELGERIKAQTPELSVNLCGKLSLREVAAVLSSAKLLLSNDSGIMHLGMELGIPVAAVFGPTDEHKYARLGPLTRIVRQPMSCAPCERSSCRFDRQHCMEDLKEEDLIFACKELLHAGCASK